MKIVINSCFGGFSLSKVGVMRYAELKGFKLYVGGDDFYPHYSKAPIRKDEEGKEIWDNDTYFSDRDIARDDIDLIKVVEELGEKADGSCAGLEVIEIPDDVSWEIEEYDGTEWIAETHRTWR